MESAAKGRARERGTQIAPRGSEGVGHRVPVSIRKWLPSLCQRTLSLPLCACAAWRSPLTHSRTGALQKPRSTACWRLPSLPVGPVRSWFGLGTTARNVHLHSPHGQGLGDCLGLALPAGRHIPMLDGRLHPAGSMLDPLNQKMDRSPFHQPTQAGARPIREVGAVVICCVALRRCLHILATGHASLFVAALARRTA